MGGWINPLQTLPQGLVLTFDFDFDFDFDPDPDPDPELDNLNNFINCNLQPTPQVVERTGVRRSDPRLQQMMTKLSKHHKKHGEENTTIENLNLDLQTFSK